MSHLSKTWTTCYSHSRLQMIQVQVLLRRGLPRFDLIGLPQSMIREGKDRILAALHSLGIEFPTQKILVSLNPGDIPKEGSHLDLPILVGILESLGHLRPSESERAFYWGELGLDGSIQPARQQHAHLLYADRYFNSTLYLADPEEKVRFLLPHLRNRCVLMKNISEIFEVDRRGESSVLHPHNGSEAVEASWLQSTPEKALWSRLKGSEHQFLAMALMILGRHHALLEGPPGVGKSSWCLAAKDLQPPLLPHEWHRKFLVKDANEGPENLQVLQAAPFEAPHHSSTESAIIGGGSGSLVPGAITRAHRGILFLDELAEFSQNVLESLREPLEQKHISIARQGLNERFPADVQILASLNPCRCGKFRTKNQCTCAVTAFHAYRERISGPLRDRFHLVSFWRYEPQDPPKEFALQRVRANLLKARARPSPSFSGLELPMSDNPRKSRLELEVFASWLRWFDISSASALDWARYQNWKRRIENEEDQNRAPTRGRNSLEQERADRLERSIRRGV